MEFATAFALVWGIGFGWLLNDLSKSIKALVEIYLP